MANNIGTSSREISNSDILFKPFRKTDDLLPGTYKVSYLRKIKGKFGTRVRCYCEDFNYDLPTGFTQQLNGYDLDDLDYTNVEMHYIGRRQDSYRTILMKLRGIPPLQSPSVESPATTIANYNRIQQEQIQNSDVTTTTDNNVLETPSTINVSTIASTTTGVYTTPTTTNVGTVSSLSLSTSSTSSTPSPSSSSSTTAVKLPVARALRFDDTIPWLGKRRSGEVIKNPNLSLASSSTPSIVIKDDDDDNVPLPKVCKICLHNPHNAVFLTCGHVDICFPCGEKFVKKPCPFCRRKVTKVMKTFGDN